jgi:REP element-mobilizing transposase RayT
MPEEYSKNGHADHIIWVTKYRYKMLKREIPLRLKELIKKEEW